MMRFLTKYRFNIILILLLAVLAFWFIPTQEDLYLKEDFKSIEKKSTKTLLWTMGFSALIILFIALKGVKKVGEVGNALFGIVALSLPIYLIFKTIFLSAFLALNRVESTDHFERKYTTTFLMETGKQTPLIYDFRARKTLFRDKVPKIEKLNGLKNGDTVIISFRLGLLGVPFSPMIK